MSSLVFCYISLSFFLICFSLSTQSATYTYQIPVLRSTCSYSLSRSSSSSVSSLFLSSISKSQNNPELSYDFDKNEFSFSQLYSPSLSAIGEAAVPLEDLTYADYPNYAYNSVVQATEGSTYLVLLNQRAINGLFGFRVDTIHTNATARRRGESLDSSVTELLNLTVAVYSYTIYDFQNLTLASTSDYSSSSEPFSTIVRTLTSSGFSASASVNSEDPKQDQCSNVSVTIEETAGFTVADDDDNAEATGAMAALFVGVCVLLVVIGFALKHIFPD